MGQKSVLKKETLYLYYIYNTALIDLEFDNTSEMESANS